MKNNSVEIVLGTQDELAAIYSYNKKFDIRLADWVGHAINQTLQRDLFYGAWADIFWQDYKAKIMGVKITSPSQDVSVYKTKIPAFLDAAKLALQTFKSLEGKINPAEIQFLLPVGLSMARTRSVQLLHFPPIETLNYRDYLYSPTNKRWESLLLINGHDGAKNSLLERITDAVPLAASGGDSKGIAPFNDEFIAYGKQMLAAGLDFNGTSTQPVVAYGSPVIKWLADAFSKQIAKPLKVLSLVEVKLTDSATTTPILCANHPSKFFYFAEETKSNPKWATKVTRQDLIAARWQIAMAADWNADAAVTLKDAKRYWKSRPDKIQKIVSEQEREFGFGH